MHASASCTPASKPGRIRCRAVLELPLDAATTQRLAWAELRITAADASVTPLRGRLGPLDAESRDDGRVAWTFSVAASAVGDRTMMVRLSTVVEPKSGAPHTTSATLVEHRIDVLVRVSPTTPP